ncbi:MarC family protein [Candidatus Woesearchaeota archaeon]|nr:MarC family protein [Candidatus Woesearchaeota archaeon]MBT3538208.1 MarC family protein [Candidatus Woesearchaeota archaeon]MBT4696717.1 MarC family protein [Candidatus Woesearchaeota archaeon]MBT4717225.1 MarC family protein [Candidatus Woesearchaeota archaeon]MBT7105877.1 MarC family protein [Candidatus Woesearchaeota archaeon]
MISAIIAYLVLLNPFALFLYLEPLMVDLSNRQFNIVLAKATLISFMITLIFFLLGDFLFQKILKIDIESMRILGGIVLFSFAYFNIVKGRKGYIQMKENLNDLASEIALPFMIGAGTLSLTIMMRHQLPFWIGVLSFLIIFSFNHIFVMLLKAFKDQISKRKFKVAYDKNMQILLRFNGFIVGAVGIDMIVTGIKTIFFS